MFINKKGFTLVELIVAVLVFALLISAVMKMISPSIKSAARTDEHLRLSLLLKDKCEQINALGFWVWDIDTENPNTTSGNAKATAEWQTQLSKANYHRKATIETVFLKENGSDLDEFSGEYDGNNPRDKVQLTLTLYTFGSKPVVEKMALVSYPSEKKLKAILKIIKKALQWRYEDFTAYPDNSTAALDGNGLEDLVEKGYLYEIPNDPYTMEKDKGISGYEQITEVTDWYYDNNGSQITLIPNSHYFSSDINDLDVYEQWSY